VSTGARRQRAGEHVHRTDPSGPTQSLLTLLDHDPVRAEVSYRQLRVKLVKFFAWRGCDTAEDLADETVLRVMRNLAHGQVIRRIDNPWVYINAVGLRVYREWVRERRRRPEPLTDELSDLERDSPLRGPLADCLHTCLNRLPREARDLLETVYLEGRRDLAARLAITPNALNLRVFHRKEELRACLRNCLGPAVSGQFAKRKRPPVI
jgi:DNA-directed RNA polymerase specialized sigma24 family protein